MRIPRKVGRFRAGIAALVLAIGALTVLPTSTQPAVAENPRSAAAENVCTEVSGLLSWQQGVAGPGVTLCVGENGSPPTGDAYLQIVDLTAGAKVRLISQGCFFDCPFTDTRRNTDLQYVKRTATEWFEWLQEPDNFRSPGPERLFSTSNGSFFVDTSPLTETSMLSLPEKSLIEIFPDGAAFVEQTWGWAFDTCTADNPHDLPIPDNCHDDAAWDKSKIAISLGDSTLPTQEVEMLDFPTHYDHTAVHPLFGNSPTDLNRRYGDQTIGYPPLDTVGASPRTYLGVDDAASKVYILNSALGLTGDEADSILGSFGAAFTMQLDGGGSTQLATDANDDGNADYLIESDDIINRNVPDTLAVYTAQ